MSVKQGLKFDSINSVDEIKPFIQFHNLDMSEVLDPLSSFSESTLRLFARLVLTCFVIETFNEFFYRKLKPDARPVTDPKDPNTLVSPADVSRSPLRFIALLTRKSQCRAMFFPTIKEATQFWIKGEKFSIAKLLGESFKEMYEGGSMCIFRLAPQDYHRFHSPVDGIVGKYSKIGAQYYTGQSLLSSIAAVESNGSFILQSILKVFVLRKSNFASKSNLPIIDSILTP